MPIPAEQRPLPAKASNAQWISELARAAAGVAAEQAVRALGDRTSAGRQVAELARIAGRVAVDSGESSPLKKPVHR